MQIIESKASLGAHMLSYIGDSLRMRDTVLHRVLD